MPDRICSFPPIIDKESRVLVLGTMPGFESLRMQQYYAYGRNDFWRIMLSLFREGESLDYDGRVSMLLRNHIAVWDVLQSCERCSSADSDIKQPHPNAIAELLTEHSGIGAVCFNGKGAAALFRRLVQPHMQRQVQYETLPSTSPAFTMPYQQKLEGWNILSKNF